MADPTAIWGAVTGTAALAVGLRREILGSRRRVRVDHGWRYGMATGQVPGIEDIWVYVMVQNTGGRDISVEHVGWEWAEVGETLHDGTRVLDVHRAEIPLEDSRLLHPDGAPFKIQTRVGHLLHLIEPLQLVTPVAFTHGGNRVWRGPSVPLLTSFPEAVDPSRLATDLARLRAEASAPVQPGGSGVYLLPPEWAQDALEGP